MKGYSIKERWLNCKWSVLFWKKCASWTKVFPWTNSSTSAWIITAYSWSPVPQEFVCKHQLQVSDKEKMIFFTCSVKSTVHTWINPKFNMSAVVIILAPAPQTTLGRYSLLLFGFISIFEGRAEAVTASSHRSTGFSRHTWSHLSCWNHTSHGVHHSLPL